MCREERRGWVWMVVLLILIFSGWYFSTSRKTRPQGEPIIQRDTIILRDTLKVAEPVEVIKERRIEVHDTMMVALTDTIRMNDTIYVQIPREVKVYSSDDYRCEVSGIQPRLDYIEVYPVTKVITERRTPKWAISLQLGVGVTRDFKVSPYAGIGISRNLWYFGK